MNKRQKQQFDKQTAKRLFDYMKEYKVKLFLVVVCILISAIANVGGSLFIGNLIDNYISPMLASGSTDFSGLLQAILTIGILFVAGILASFFYNWTMAVVSQGTLKRIRDDMFVQMQKLPIPYFDQHSHGDLMSHYTNDTDTLRQMISQSIPQLINAVVTIVAVFFAMLSVSIWLTILVVISLFFIMNAIGKIAGQSGKFFVRQQEVLGATNGFIEEMIHGQKVVKVFGHEEEAKADFKVKNDELKQVATKANAYANILMPAMNNMGYILYVVIAIVGGGLGIAKVTNISLTGFGVLTLGMIASFLQLSRSFIQPLGMVSQQLGSVIMALAGAKRIFELIDAKEEEDHGYVTLVNAKEDENGEIVETDEHTGMWAWKHPHEDGSLTYTKLCGEVRMYDVDFAYEENKPVLHNITLYAKPGQKIAFVGATGAGKTTITNLINRFYDIADGKIRYDGININKIKKSDLRRSLGVVLQDVNLFTGTVMDNIRYGNLNATDEECINAAKLANADRFIQMLPEGYNTVLSGDGSGLSQGQRQLLSIARAAVADPPVMILDEATSSIDTRTESIVQRGMDALMEGRTVFVIAHRLSTVKNSNAIMVLDHGRIIERGDHDELIAQKGNYYQLYTGAFELS